MKGGLKYFCIGLLIAVTIVVVLVAVFIFMRSTNELTELKQVHVIFTHGERTPTKSEAEIFPLNIRKNEAFEPYGFGALTNQGKMTMYILGETIKKKYDSLLSKVYNQEYTVMQAVDSDISKMSALLVLAGLWPVNQEQKWNDILWQPIPYISLEATDDYMLFSSNCIRYMKERERVTKEYIEHMPEVHREIYENLTLLTGRSIVEPTQVRQLINLFTAQENMNIANPEWLTDFAMSLEDISQVDYNLMFKNTLLRKLGGGSVLQKIIMDSKQTMMENTTSTPKIIMYSGYSNNIAAILAATEMHKLHSPEFGATILVELHYRPKINNYIFKIYYMKNITAEPVLLKLPDCDTYCTFDEFKNNLNDVLVEDYKEECQPV